MTNVLQIIGDILSFATISSCLIAKVPQILTIYQNQNAVGLSMKGLVIETVSYTVSTLYNYTNGYRILNYFEYIILLCQNYTLIAIVLFYRNQIRNQKLLMMAVAYFFVTSLFGMHILPKSILTFLIPGTLPMSATSKILQLVEIIKSKDSSSISSITWFISAFTNATRIYTIFLDSADVMLLTNFIVSTVLSSAVYAAVLYYKKPKVKDE